MLIKWARGTQATLWFRVYAGHVHDSDVDVGRCFNVRVPIIVKIFFLTHSLAISPKGFLMAGVGGSSTLSSSPGLVLSR